MKILRRTLTTAAVAVMLAAGYAETSGAAPGCLEDEPCWHWPTMGNLERGVTVKSGKLRVVEPCTFAYLDMRGRIDWKRTPRLRGDGFARRHGCNPHLYA